MKYIVKLLKSDFKIDNEGLKKLYSILASSPYHIVQDFKKIELLIEFDNDGICSIKFIGDESSFTSFLGKRRFFNFFKKISPCVKSNSWIEFIDEVGKLWRYYFVNGEILNIEATISYKLPDREIFKGE